MCKVYVFLRVKAKGKSRRVKAACKGTRDKWIKRGSCMGMDCRSLCLFGQAVIFLLNCISDCFPG